MQIKKHKITCLDSSPEIAVIGSFYYFYRHTYCLMPTFPATGLATSTTALLASLLNNSPHGVIAYEALRNEAGDIIDYRTIYYNPRVLVITGHTHEEMTTLGLFERAPYARELKEELRKVVEEQCIYDTQQLVPTLNRWFSFENRPLGDGYFTTLQDIHDLKQTEQELEKQNLALKKSIEDTTEQHLLLSSVLNTSPNSISVERAVRDSNGTIVDFQVILINPAALLMAGLSEADVLARRNSELDPAFVSSGMLAAYRAVVETGESHKAEFFVPLLSKHMALSITRMDADHIIVLFDDITQAHLTAKSLQQKNELLDGILRTSESAIMVYEAIPGEQDEPLDFRVILANDAALRTTGCSRQDVVGYPLSAINHQTKESGLWDKYVSVYKTNELFRGKHFYPNLNKWFDATISKLGNGLVATHTDISQIYSATQQIEEQAQLFEGVLANITNGLSVLKVVRDEAGNLHDLLYVCVSQAILTDTGKKREELLNNSMLTLFPGVQQTVYWTAFQAAFTSGEPQHFQYRYDLDGFDNYTDNWVTRLDQDRLISVYSIINEQKKAESFAQQQAAILQTVLDGCQTSIALFEAIRNPAGQIIDFRYLIQNIANARLVGHPQAETTTKTMLEVLPGLKTSGIFDRYVAVTETGVPQQFEQQFTDGTVDGWFDISVVKQDDGIAVAANDHTLLHQTLQHTEQLVIDLQHSNHNLEQFAYIASHDLQEPLRKIQSFGNLLLDQYGDQLPDEGQMMMRRMQMAAERMSQLIRDLLAYSRLTGTQEPFTSVNLLHIIAEIKTDLELVILEKKALITVADDMAQTLPSLSGDPLQLRQLFQNLLSNALKFVRPNVRPQVLISARFVTPEEISATFPNRQKRSCVAIDIADNGIGFDQKYEERIFQLFERLHGRSESQARESAWRSAEK